MALDRKHLRRTHRDLNLVETSAEQITRLSADYPTQGPDPSGGRLRLSRLPRTDPRIGSQLETEFARWIPGNPFDALLAVFLFTREGSPAPQPSRVPPSGASALADGPPSCHALLAGHG